MCTCVLQSSQILHMQSLGSTDSDRLYPGCLNSGAVHLQQIDFNPRLQCRWAGRLLSCLDSPWLGDSAWKCVREDKFALWQFTNNPLPIRVVERENRAVSQQNPQCG